MLPRDIKLDIRPVLDGEVNINPDGCDVGEVSGSVQRQIICRFGAELRRFFCIVAGHPAGGGDIDRFERPLYLVLCFQALGHHVELQDVDCAQWESVARSAKLTAPVAIVDVNNRLTISGKSVYNSVGVSRRLKKTKK